jgi:hypothetical protein
MTMSIAARCPLTGMLGVAVASSSIAVASRCANVRAGVGAALSQNVTDPSLGRLALDLMESGQSARMLIELFLHRASFHGMAATCAGPMRRRARGLQRRSHAGIVWRVDIRDLRAAGNLLANPNRCPRNDPGF